MIRPCDSVLRTNKHTTFTMTLVAFDCSRTPALPQTYTHSDGCAIALPPTPTPRPRTPHYTPCHTDPTHTHYPTPPHPCTRFTLRRLPPDVHYTHHRYLPYYLLLPAPHTARAHAAHRVSPRMGSPRLPTLLFPPYILPRPNSHLTPQLLPKLDITLPQCL